MTRDAGSDTNDTANPFASPADLEGWKKRPQLKQTTFPNALARWILICAVSAAPSFAMGLGMTNKNPFSIAAMVIGILIFAFGYAYLDISPRWRGWMSQTSTRRAIITVFSIRVGASIVFPIALMNDLFVGAFSASSVQAIIKFCGGAQSSPGTLGPFSTLATTIVEGALLNAEILFVGLVLCAIFRAFESGDEPLFTDSESENPFTT